MYVSDLIRFPRLSCPYSLSVALRSWIGALSLPIDNVRSRPWIGLEVWFVTAISALRPKRPSCSSKMLDSCRPPVCSISILGSSGAATTLKSTGLPDSSNSSNCSRVGPANLRIRISFTFTTFTTFIITESVLIEIRSHIVCRDREGRFSPTAHGSHGPIDVSVLAWRGLEAHGSPSHNACRKSRVRARSNRLNDSKLSAPRVALLEEHSPSPRCLERRILEYPW